MFNGKIHYKWQFSIATLNYQRVGKMMTTCINELHSGGAPEFLLPKPNIKLVKHLPNIISNEEICIYTCIYIYIKVFLISLIYQPNHQKFPIISNKTVNSAMVHDFQAPFFHHCFMLKNQPLNPMFYLII